MTGKAGQGVTRWTARCLPFAVVLFVLAGAGAAAGASQAPAASHRAALKATDDPPNATAHDVSPPLADIAATAPGGDGKKEKKEKKQNGYPVPAGSTLADPVVQATAGAAAAPALGLGFDGVGQGFTGPAGTFGVQYAPPDTNGAVGPNNYVQLVNTAFAVFDKAGHALYGPVPTNTIWSGFGGGCQANNDGDATVEYDRAADRWIFSQFSVSTTPYLQCVAVSTSSDPRGSYYRYSFQYANFPDYPKLGVWSDAYYITFNMFRGGSTFVGPEMCAYDRAKMLTGQAATQQCYVLGTSHGGLLPSDLDGSTPPPAGSPNYMLEFGTNSLLLYKFHVNWTTASSTFTGPTTIPVAAFSPACSGGGACIPQPGTVQLLDSLADRLMYRLAYRNLGDHEALVVNHSVTAGTSVGVRWYELRDPNGTATVFQQGTYAPDSSYRWMGSAAMDGNGDIALGFSVASKTVYPSIHYTAHLTSDPLGVMGQGEGVLVNGTGSQNGGLERWGDYSSLSVDPSDDCTFWYTSEYLTLFGSWNWHTRIGTFRLPGCGAPDFALSATPSSRTVNQGDSTSYAVSVSPEGTFASSVDLSVTGLPTGADGTFAPNPTASTSTLSVTTSPTTPAGSYPLTITGTGGGITHTTTVTLVVQAPVPDFSLSASPGSQTVRRGGTASYAVTINAVNGFTGPVTLSVQGVPNKTTASFSPNPATSTSTLTISTSTKTSKGTRTLTITGKSGGVTRTTTVTLTVTA
jgi:hypothetical protein